MQSDKYDPALMRIKYMQEIASNIDFVNALPNENIQASISEVRKNYVYDNPTFSEQAWVKFF